MNWFPWFLVGVAVGIALALYPEPDLIEVSPAQSAWTGVEPNAWTWAQA